VCSRDTGRGNSREGGGGRNGVYSRDTGRGNSRGGRGGELLLRAPLDEELAQLPPGSACGVELQAGGKGVDGHGGALADERVELRRGREAVEREDAVVKDCRDGERGPPREEVHEQCLILLLRAHAEASCDARAVEALLGAVEDLVLAPLHRLLPRRKRVCQPLLLRNRLEDHRRAFAQPHGPPRPPQLFQRLPQPVSARLPRPARARVSAPRGNSAGGSRRGLPRGPSRGEKCWISQLVLHGIPLAKGEVESGRRP